MILERSNRHRGQAPLPDPGDLRARLRRTWYLGAGILFLSQVGLAVVHVMQGGIDPGFWPWEDTEPALLFGLITANLALLIFLSLEQRRALDLHAMRRRWNAERAGILGRHRQVLGALIEVARTAGSDGEAQAVFEQIARVCHRTFPCDQACLMLLEADRAHLVVRAAIGHPDGVNPVGDRWKLGEGVSGWVAKHGRPLLLGPDLPEKRFRDLRARDYTSTAAMVVPVMLRDDLTGVLSVTSRDSARHYDDQDLEALQIFAETVAITCRSAEQREWARQAILAVNEDRPGKSGSPWAPAP